MPGKIPVRRCVGCGERRPKRELVRIVHNRDNGEITVDKTGKARGRGAYICPDRECLKKARKSNSFSRTLKISVPEEVYNNLMEEIDRMD